MPHGLDHIVHAVRDLDAAAEFYRRAGFTVGGRNQHPWGTHNRVVQFRNAYIEILEVAEPDKIVPHHGRSFSFGAFNRDFLNARQGLSMLLLNSRDADTDNRMFEAAGIGQTDLFEFAREGKKPDGTAVKLAFSLAFAADAASPHVHFAVCQHHFPENFWNPAFQIHDNGVRAVKGVTLVAAQPDWHRDFLSAFSAGAVTTYDGGITCRTENGEIEILTPDGFKDQFGVEVNTDGDGMLLSAIRLDVDDLDRTEAGLRDHAIVCARRRNTLSILPQQGYGAILIFEADNPASMG